MRKLRRSMAKAAMQRAGYSKVNRRMRKNQWRRIIGLHPVHVKNGQPIKGDYHGPKKAMAGSRTHLLAY